MTPLASSRQWHLANRPTGEPTSTDVRFVTVDLAPLSENEVFMQRAIADVPMKRAGEADEIAELVLFMCSDACEYMTANTVYVNGGGGFR